MLLLLGLLAGCGENRTFPGPTPYAPGEEPRFTCVPNLDGVLEAGEVPVLIGGEVAYLVNPEGVSRRVDLDGVVDASGQRVWDLGADFADDRVVGVGPMALTDQWFADDFPGGDYVAPVDLRGTVLGVYHLDERGLWLHGVASAEPDPPAGRTLLPYDAPVPLYRFPLTQGDRYTVVGEVSVGTALGLAYRGTDTYEVEGYILVGRRVWHMEFNRDRSRLFTTNGVSGDVTVIDVANREAIKSIKVGRFPWGAAFRPTE